MCSSTCLYNYYQLNYNNYINFSICLCTIDSQQRHEDELMQLQEKLQSLSDDHDNDSCQSPDAGENDAEELPANGETHGDERKDAVNESGQAKTSRQKLHEILNVELSVFCEKMCSSETGDVSKEAETNQRHEVAKGVDENLSAVDGTETESNAPGTAMFDSTDKKKSGNEDFIEEIDNLKRKLADSLFHFVSSNEGKIFAKFFSPECLLRKSFFLRNCKSAL